MVLISSGSSPVISPVGVSTVALIHDVPIRDIIQKIEH